MIISDVVSQIDFEIERLQKAKAILAALGSSESRPARKRRKQRTLSPEARARIAAAQRKRWAKQRKAAK